MAGGVGCRAHLLHPGSHARERAREALVHARDAAVPLRQGDAHGPRPQLHDGGRRHALPPPERLDRAASDGLGRVRPAGRERRDPRGRPSARDHRAQHRNDARPDAASGLGDRLGPRGLGAPARLLPLDAMAVPALLREGAGLPEGSSGQLVPEGPDRDRERVRRRRPVRALRHAGRAAQPDAVVLQGDGVRGRAAGVRASAGRLVAGADKDDPAQLDRPKRGRGHPLPSRGAGHRHRGVHDAAGHDLRRDLLRRRAGACVRGRARERGGAGLRAARGRATHGGARGRPGEDGSLHRLLRDQPGHRREAAGVRRRLCPDGLRDGRDHGRARPRRARPRVRRGLRPAGSRGDRRGRHG